MNILMSGFETMIWFKEDSNDWIEQHPNLINRGFLFGDGLFETMIFSGGKIRFSEAHWQRLKEGCKILGLEISSITSSLDLEKFISQKFGMNRYLRIRWSVFRKGMGKYTPETDNISQVLQIQEFIPPAKIKRKSYINDSIRVPSSNWSHCKTLNALTYVLANRERQQKQMDEVILLSTDGFVSEAGAANVFWISKGQFHTPSLACNGIAGVARKMVLEKLNEHNMPIIEGAFEPNKILAADKIFTTNVTGISYLEKIGDSNFDVVPIDFLEALFIPT